MKLVIRRLRRRGESVVYKDEPVNADVITIGRSADQTVFLPDIRVALQHAELRPMPNKRFSLRAFSLAGVTVNGAATSAATVGIGDRILIGRYRIELLPPDADSDAEIIIGLEELPDASADADREGGVTRTRLEQTLLRKRPLAWLSLIVVLLLVLAAPLAYRFDPAFSERTAGLPVPTDAIWESGPMSAAHSLVSSQCKNCHETPFVRVRDSACMTCHAAVAGHAPTQSVGAAMMESPHRCTSCHREHNGASGLTSRHPELCVACHADPTRQMPMSDIPGASDFAKHHPNFRAVVPGQAANGDLIEERVDESKFAITKEQSGLKFPHDVHLAGEGIRGADGDVVMACADCHQPTEDGRQLRPVNMEAHCESCHQLDFDPQAPDRRLPHAPIAEIEQTIREYFAWVALSGGYDDAAAPPIVRNRRRPGQRLTARQTLDATNWAEQRSALTTREVVEDRVCVVCHELATTAGALPDISLVRINARWFHGALFDHSAHGTESCDSCHAAQASESSADILIPGIENCRACHGGFRSRDKVPSACIDCHAFHSATATTGAIRFGQQP